MTARRALALFAALAGAVAACSRVVDLTIDAPSVVPDSPTPDGGVVLLPDGGFADTLGSDGA
jgi:hypothetical protein